VGIARRAGLDGGSLCDLGQARVSRLADLDRPVVDELGSDQAATRGRQDRRGRPGGSDDPAGRSGRQDRKGAGPADAALPPGQGPEEGGGDRSDARPEPGGAAPYGLQ
jgi:hypothetical protein